MTTKRTYTFLPTVFQTDTNKKFLSATIDQLVTEPNLQTLYGYIGRKFAPTYKTGDSYVTENTKDRQNYQLEPGVVIRNELNEISFFSNYKDLLDQIGYYGGLTNNHDRLFEQEYYSYDPKISYDKLVNFSQYYWVPDGPAPVSVSTSGLDLTITYTVTRDPSNSRYVFMANGVVDNSITLARGGVYEFIVDQPGFPLWIQTEIGTDGTLQATPTISARDVAGVENNGIDQGTITLRVPQANSQDRYVNMEIVYTPDYALTLPYSGISNKTLSQFLVTYPQYAGSPNQLNGKFNIFLTTDELNNLGETAWTNGDVYDADGDMIPGYSAGDVVPEASRYGVWRMVYVSLGQKLRLSAPLVEDITTATSLTVGSSNVFPLYPAPAGQEFVYVSGAIVIAEGSAIKKTDVVATVVATTDTTNVLDVTATENFVADMPLVFSDSTFGGLAVETTYYVKEILSGASLTVSATIGGPAVALTTATGVMTMTGSFATFADGTIVDSIADQDPLIKLIYEQDVDVDEKVYIKYGIDNANKEYFKDVDGFFKQVPLITAPLDKLYIQDTALGNMYTPVKVVNYLGWDLDVENDIVGKKYYTSPNGVEFTSGLKIAFGDDVTPDLYQNREFYVECVGDTTHGIQLIPVDELVTPEAFNEEIVNNYPGEIFPDYITISRASKDRNGWSRNNRWFHIDVLNATATYNGTQETFSNAKRGQRPIVQFDPDLQLVNDGRIGKKPVDIFDATTQNAFVDLQGRTIKTVFGIDILDDDNAPVYPNGLRVIFGADVDPLVRNKIYDLNYIQYDVDTNGAPSGPYFIELTLADDGNVTTSATAIITKGAYKGSQWWFNGVNWIASQQKEYLHQAPLFDVLDTSGKSYTTYFRSTFPGTQLFGYLRSTTGTADSVLSRGPVAPVLDSDLNPVTDFILNYKNFTTQGDINFKNYFNTDTFTYVDDAGLIITMDVNLGFLQRIVDAETLAPANTWLTVVEPSHQYQAISYTFTGQNNPFTVDVSPDANEKTIPYAKVFKNSTYLTPMEWALVDGDLTILGQLAINDKIDILIFSHEVSDIGSYQIPKNLELNAQNIDIDTLTLGQLRNHLIALSQNSTMIDGNVLSQSNLRDISIKAQGGTILQHSAPVPYASLFLSDKQANFINSVRYAQHEYTKFKNKFLDLSLTLPGIKTTDPVASVDAILAKINLVKNKTFPWYYSDMVPYGTLKNIVGQIGDIDGFRVFDPLKTNYEITEVFNDTVLNNKAVLVYVNDLQLIKGEEYSFNKDTPSIDFLVSLEVDDIVKIVEYSNTDGNYIPETPTKLGLWPSYKPEKFYDTTYREAIFVIRGHDGSITPTFGDYRDDFLLELEKRIYNNIKLTSNDYFLDIYKDVPGKFRNSDYSLADMNKVLDKSFLSWVGNNKIDFATNDTFDSNDPFTWNYASSVDRVDGENLPGSWRACFHYFYDTYRPHITPWVMLGFSTQPSWWEGFYGPGPYTGGNMLLWDDLEAGYIRYGERAGIDLTYARPGLTSFIPVDANGNLLAPAQILCKSFNSKRSAEAWAVGHVGPAEFAWRTSSDYPYAMQQAMALLKPAKYFGSLVDVSGYNTDNLLNTADTDSTGEPTGSTQYLLTGTIHHIVPTEIKFNGYVTNGTVVTRSAGYVNWISDYLINQGVNPTSYLLPLLEKFQVNLAYKVAGYTDQKYLQVLAEQVSPTSTNESILVPNENYTVFLNTKPVPVDTISYSAVIIEKTPNGYTVRGYDLFNSFFTVIPSIVNNNANKITVLNNTVAIYKDFESTVVNIPYGTEFTSQQQLADFLISYERYLIAQGFVFAEVDESLGQLKDWKLSVREFLYWAQQGWKPGSILVVSPVSNKLNANTFGAITDGINDSQYGSKVIDQNFNLIKNNKYTVFRSPTEFSVTLDNPASVIGYVEVDLVQYEHTLVFDNTTVFNDVIYQPESGNRQFRLKLVGQKTGDWNGSLSPEGYIYNSGEVKAWNQGKDYLMGDLVQYKNQYYTALDDMPASATFQFRMWQVTSKDKIQKGLLPNFSTLAVESQSYYDSYGEIRNKEQLDYSHALIGFKERQYLADLGLTKTSQIEFYKGYVAQKGTKNAVDAFTSATINNLSSTINLYEEWAMRVGAYGALSNNPFVELTLDEKTFGVNPAVARLVDSAANNEGNGLDIFNESQVYKMYGDYTANIALNRTSASDYDNDVLTAGYVNLDDVDAQIFDLTNYKDLDNIIEDMGSGYVIWVAKDFNQSWNVYRVTETNNEVTAVANSLNGYITYTTKVPHLLVKDDVFLVKSFVPEFNGFFQVVKVVDTHNVLVAYTGDVSALTTIEDSGLLYRLDSVRFRYMEDSRVYGLSNPPNGWKLGDKIWIDQDAETSSAQNQPYGDQPAGWKVYEKAEPWQYEQEVLKGTTGEYSTSDGFGTSVKMSSNGLIITVGAPTTGDSGFGTGLVNTFLKNFAGEYESSYSLIPTTANTSAFGQTVEMATDDEGTTTLAVGAPTSAYGNGYVLVYDKNINSQEFQRTQVLYGNVAGDRFGSSLAFDKTGEWLYVGAPNNDSVYVYGLNKYIPTHSQVKSINNTYTMFLSSNIALLAGDTLIQESTDVRATVVSATGNAVVVNTITNFISNVYSNGGAFISNVLVSANLNIFSGGNLTMSNVFPTRFTSNATTTSMTLNFTPIEQESIVITDNFKTYIPGKEYTVSGSTVTFASPVSQTSLTITQQPYYKLVNKLRVPTGNVGINFGYALSSSFEGEQVAVGAPNDTVADINNVLQPSAGSVFVFTRISECFDSVVDAVPGSGNADYMTENDIACIHRVEVGSVEVTDYTVIGTNIVRFAVPPAIGQVVCIETNNFRLLEKLVGIDNLTGGLEAIQANAHFGSSLTICSNNCAIYIGAPDYNNGNDYDSGAVWKFHNKGRLYGTNAGTTLNPVFTPINTIRLNDFNIRVNLGLTGNITANVGDYISQPSTGANVQVTEATIGDYIKVSGYLNSNVFTTGANIRVNGNFVAPNVSVRVSTLNEFVQDINDANILGITATNADGYLKIDSSVTVAKNKMRIVADEINTGTRGPLEQAGITVFAFMQIILNPFSIPNERFGSYVRLASNAYMLLIGAENGTTRELASLDAGLTVLDDDTTRLEDDIPATGSVYIYELYDDPRNEVEHPGRYSFAQQLNTNGLLPGGRFGHSIDVQGTSVVVTSLRGTVEGAPTNSGSVHVFRNPTLARGWTLLRYQQPTVELSSMPRAFLYNKQTGLIQTNLQFIDPAKGRILGLAEQEIAYKTEYDPAIYNKGNKASATINTSMYWGELQVGKVWWNLSKVRYIDYEQDTLTYRSLYWGELFNGSKIEVAEWIMSDVPPSQFVGDGTPLNPDDDAYVEEIYVDDVTSFITTRYYFWVTNRTVVDEHNLNRRLTTTTIADFIENPKNQDIPYIAMIRSDALAFYNISDFLSASDSIAHLDYQKQINTDIVHSEYELVQKDNPNSLIPVNLVNKLIDSLAGIDSNGSIVPDPTLNPSNRYGIEVRPRQSMFVDRLKAINEMVTYVNNIFIANPIVEQFDLTGLAAEEPQPIFNLGEYDQKVATELELSYIDTAPLDTGYLVLVEQDTNQNGLWVLYQLTDDKTWMIIKVQSYKTSLYWKNIDWYADGYSGLTKPNFSVETTVDALKLQASEGVIIYINNATGNNTWQLVIVDSDLTLKVIGIQNGTIQLTPNLANYEDNALGFGNQEFDSNRLDQNPNKEIRFIVEALYNDIFVNTLAGEFNKLFFVMVNYLLTEQPYVDWVFKSSFISITHKLRTLSQFPSYVVDNQTYYQDYINEVKPYRTKIREYLLNYTGNDNFDGDITDFDLPAYYDTSTITSLFRSPNGESPYIAQDEAKWQTTPYNQWYNNRALQVNRVQVSNGGANYTSVPTVTITSVDGNGSGATAIAIIDGNTNTISNIAVTNSGVGYTTSPLITINGNGTETATAYAVMNNPMVRSFNSTLKFDRVQYHSNVKVWSANTIYAKTEFDANGRVASGDIISYALTSGNVLQRKSYFVNNTMSSGPVFVVNDYTLCPSEYFDNANDRLVGFYEPTNDVPAIDIIESAITIANTATNTTALYVYNSENLIKNMYLSGANIPSVYVTEIAGNIAVMINTVGTFVGNITAGISSIEGIDDLTGVQVGDYVVGPGIGFESVIVGINANTGGINLSDAISSTMTGAVISFGGVPVKVTQLIVSEPVTLDINTTIVGRKDCLNQLMTGLSEPGAITQGPAFKITPKFGRTFDVAPFDPIQFSSGTVGQLSGSVYDEVLRSKFSDTTIGTSPEDIITKGGMFVDEYYSHAPEELIPGIMFDTLDMQIYTKTNGNANVVAYRVFDNMMDKVSYMKISSANTTVLTSNLSMTDANVYVADVGKLTDPSPDFGIPGVVFINGERITYYKKVIYVPEPWAPNTRFPEGTAISESGINYVVTGNVTANNWSYVNTANVVILPGTELLSQIRRGTQGTSTPEVHVFSANVIDGSASEVLPNTIYGNVITDANVIYNLGSGFAVDGNGLEGSNSDAANFIKGFPVV